MGTWPSSALLGMICSQRFETSEADYETRMNLVGGFNHLEKYESQWEGLSHILWKIKNI